MSVAIDLKLDDERSELGKLIKVLVVTSECLWGPDSIYLDHWPNVVHGGAHTMTWGLCFLNMSIMLRLQMEWINLCQLLIKIATWHMSVNCYLTILPSPPNKVQKSSCFLGTAPNIVDCIAKGKEKWIENYVLQLRVCLCHNPQDQRTKWNYCFDQLQEY